MHLECALGKLVMPPTPNSVIPCTTWIRSQSSSRNIRDSHCDGGLQAIVQNILDFLLSDNLCSLPSGKTNLSRTPASAFEAPCISRKIYPDYVIFTSHGMALKYYNTEKTQWVEMDFGILLSD